MNVKVNGLLSYLDEVEGIFVCPSCGDESLPIGAAYLSYCKENEFRTMPRPLHTLYLGPSINRSEVDTRVRSVEGIIVESPQSMPTRVAELLAKGEIVARCSGRAEFGARALGNRSIFADPSKPLSIRTLNQMIKMRDFWMPFAPVLLATRQNRYLVNPKGTSSPYMMFGFDTLPERFEEMVAALQPGDRSARPQILEGGQNPEYEALLAEFERITGRSVLLNTSFNIHGEPMVASVAQALDVFQRSGLRWLWLNHLLVHKV